MSEQIWRVLPAALPPWPEACGRCAAPVLHCTGRFRVNAHGRAHDVWLLYRCPGCAAGRKRPVHRGVRERRDQRLDAFRRDDPLALLQWAFRLSPGVAVPHRVERPQWPERGPVRIRIEMPLDCGLRWDGLLAGELTLPRGRIRALWDDGSIALAPPARARSRVRHGQRGVLAL